ncbi:response regulator [Marinomonas sp. PE14-40]|uniref:response regulator n=1 Tax=Marinomonas sp. PE14-40 TaxID=3060621 RepID=UPI003F675840
MKVLIIDDSRAVQLIIRRALEKGDIENLETKLASSGIQALAILENWHPDLVLSDLHMPKMSGIELLTEINRQMLKLNVGLITTETDDSRLRKVKQCGVKFIINKPFNDTELLQKIKLFLPTDKPLLATPEMPPQKANVNLAKNTLNLPGEAELEDALAEIFFRDVRVTTKNFEKYESQQYPYLLGMMTPMGKDQVKAICILKQTAIKQISTVFSSLHPGALNSQQDRALLCDHFFRVLDKFIMPNESIESLVFKKSNLITKPFTKIDGFYRTKKEKKKDYLIEIKGFESFVVTLIAA